MLCHDLVFTGSGSPLNLTFPWHQEISESLAPLQSTAPWGRQKEEGKGMKARYSRTNLQREEDAGGDQSLAVPGRRVPQSQPPATPTHCLACAMLGTAPQNGSGPPEGLNSTRANWGAQAGTRSDPFGGTEVAWLGGSDELKTLPGGGSLTAELPP